MAIKFEDVDIERAVIAACLNGVEYWKNVPEAWFYNDICKKTYRELKSFLKAPYNTYPTTELVFEKSENVDVKLFVKEVSTIKLDHTIINTRVYDLFEMYAARKVYDIAQTVPNDLEKTRVEEVVRAKMRELAELVNPFEVGQRKRGFIYESAKARWERYRDVERDPALLKRIPYGIRGLDENTNGGTKPGHITLFYARSGGYKTKVKSNIAYNMAFMDKMDVIYISLEVPIEECMDIIDSRNALINFDGITASNLDETSREKYRQALSRLCDTKPSLYFTDIPGDATTADLIGETELYYITNGKYPQVLFLDYINEIDPVTPWGGTNTGAKFKNVGKELRHFARTYKIATISSMQENKKARDEKKHKEKIDLEHIGESYSMANVCHLVVNLYQDEDGNDEASNTLNWGIKKNRYGKSHINFQTFINPAINYVGDRTLILTDG